MNKSASPASGDTSSASAAQKFRRRSKRMRKLFPYLLVAPAVIYLMGITLYPGIYAIVQSFHIVPLMGDWIPAGWENYDRLMGDPQFWRALWNTFLMGSIALCLECVIALTLAFYAYRDPWVTGWRILFLMPMLFMPSAVAFIFKLGFLDGRVFADILMRLGIIDQNIAYQSSAIWSRAILVLADVWQWTPFLFIIFVAALQGQDEEVEEAARLDGATWFQVFWNVSLPMMKPVIAVALILRGIDITTMFANVFIVTRGGPAFTTETISYFVYRTGFRSFDFGYASAASVIMLILTIIIAQFVVKRAFVSARA